MFTVSAVQFHQLGLHSCGFRGFHPLPQPTLNTPEGPGVYVVLRAQGTPVAFLDNDPTLVEGSLERRWVPNASVLYIGQTANLRRRLAALANQGAGRAVSGWGGRVLWQVRDRDSLSVAWLPHPEPARLRGELLDAFLDQHDGRPPFGNQKLTRC